MQLWTIITELQETGVLKNVRSAVKQDYTGFIRLPRHKERLGAFL